MGLPIFLYATRRREEFRVFATSVLAAFICCYLISILIPVKGPFHHFGSLVSRGLPSFFAPLVVRMLEGASSVGTAFPSSHVAVSVCAWIVSRRVLGRFSYLVLLIVVGIVGGTVYGGFHYAIDAGVGFIVGLVIGLLGPRLYAGLLGIGRLRRSARGAL
jgi:membrane-associated phospholipid phosphatase